MTETGNSVKFMNEFRLEVDTKVLCIVRVLRNSAGVLLLHSVLRTGLNLKEPDLLFLIRNTLKRIKIELPQLYQVANLLLCASVPPPPLQKGGSNINNSSNTSSNG